MPCNDGINSNYKGDRFSLNGVSSPYYDSEMIEPDLHRIDGINQLFTLQSFDIYSNYDSNSFVISINNNGTNINTKNSQKKM